MADDLLEGVEKWYAPIEAAAVFGLEVKTIQGMCRDGRIKATKVGTMWRILKSEMKRYIDKGPRTQEEIERDKRQSVHSG